MDNKKKSKNRKNKPIIKVSENKEKGQRDMKAGELNGFLKAFSKRKRGQ